MKYILSGIVCCLFVAQAVAQDRSSAIKKTTDSIHIAVLDEVVVTASRVAEKLVGKPHRSHSWPQIQRGHTIA